MPSKASLSSDLKGTSATSRSFILFMLGVLVGRLPRLFDSEFYRTTSGNYCSENQVVSKTVAPPKSTNNSTVCDDSNENNKSWWDYVAPLIFPLDGDGMIDFPATVTSVVIDVGARDSDYLNDYFMTDKTTALILVDPIPESFVPLLSRVAAVAQKNSRADLLDPRWKNKVMVTRVAMSDEEGVLPFNVAPNPSCGSLLKTKADNPFWCHATVSTIQTVVLRLDRVLKLMPQRIQQLNLKVDAEGADLRVLMGAGDMLRQFDTVIIECVAPNVSWSTREGECRTEVAVEYMASKGFNHWIEKQGRSQVNIMFTPHDRSVTLPWTLQHPNMEFSAFYKRLWN